MTWQLLTTCVRGFGETLAIVGRCAADGTPLRFDGALGASLPGAAPNPWMDAVVALPGATLPADDELPTCVWTTGDSVPGRREDAKVRTPCMGLDLGSWSGASERPVEPVSGEDVGRLNALAYGDASGVYATTLAAVEDEALTRYGVREDGRVVAVALRVAVEDDVSVQYVATDPAFQRRGLATSVMTGLLSRAKADGFRTATLQASPDGLPVYERLGFVRLGELRGFVRDA